MQAHPIPQQILDVEFKLFGSFTLKQFGKMVIGCTIALIIFSTPALPGIVKFPLIGVVLIIGFLSAIVDNFGIWVWNFTKAIFISPRYIWLKSDSNVNILKRNQSSSAAQSQQAQAAQQNTQQRKVNIDEIPLDKIFSSTSKNSDNLSTLSNDSLDLENDDVGSIYKEVFGKDVYKDNTALESAKPEPQSQPTLPVQQENLQRADQSASLQDQIENLKFQLSKAVAENNSDLQEEIRNQIADLYNKLKVYQQPIASTVAPGSVVVDSQGKEIARGQHVFGILVTKDNRPVESAKVILKDTVNNTQYLAVSNNSGKFYTTQMLPKGTYEISIQHPQIKFHVYKIDITDQSLPAFKFRER